MGFVRGWVRAFPPKEWYMGFVPVYRLLDLDLDLSEWTCFAIRQEPTEPWNTGPWLADNQSRDLNNEFWLVLYLIRSVPPIHGSLPSFPSGGASEIANYGEYSGAPSEGQTYEYAKTILSLMTRRPNDLGKCLIIGGGIANFTNVASTFKVR